MKATYYEVWASTPNVETKRFETRKEAKAYYEQQFANVPADNYIELTAHYKHGLYKLICQQQF